VTVSEDILSQIGRIGVIPVVTLEAASQAGVLANALLAGGVSVIEITLRTPAALEAIRTIRAQVPQTLVGAGTVLSKEQGQAALDAGASFMVSPGYDDEFVDWCLDHALPVLPGTITPTEIMAARKRGLRVVKFFPADVYGGPRAIKTLSDPFPEMKYVPTGGITLTMLSDYLQLPSIFAVGGSWMVSKTLIASEQFDEITRLARESTSLVAKIRQN
jgi:2-dehydro-3-deoxyphosphogluconate aldolase/(4S)-4-hydroxy-2-oxoglutarate aldolase